MKRGRGKDAAYWSFPPCWWARGAEHAESAHATLSRAAKRFNVTHPQTAVQPLYLTCALILIEQRYRNKIEMEQTSRSYGLLCDDICAWAGESFFLSLQTSNLTSSGLVAVLFLYYYLRKHTFAIWANNSIVVHEVG